MSENINENIDLELMAVINAAPCTLHDNELMKYGWEIAQPDGSTLGQLQGEHESEADAINAGIRYLRANRPDLVLEARKVARQGMRYRAQQK